MSSPAAPAQATVTATPVYKRKLFWVALLYFSEGLPLGVFYDIFPVYFRQQGVNLADIGLLSLLGLAWTVKFLWAPAVDRLRLPGLARFGQRCSWLWLAAVLLAALGARNPYSRSVTCTTVPRNCFSHARLRAVR